MEKSCPPPLPPPPHQPTDSNHTSNGNGKGGDNLLKQLNKCSLKISKPAHHHPRKPLDPSASSHPHNLQLNPPPPSSSSSSAAQPHAQQQQPPVYNINKNDFRDVVQKLTGISPTRGQGSAPTAAAPPPLPPSPPLQAPKPPGSRFHRFRPPPLAPPPPTPPPSFVQHPSSAHPPFSPLPPLPTVCAAAESPISAYLRFLHGSVANQSFPLPPQSPPFAFPPFPLLSPTGGQMGFPASPGLPVPSPRWRDL